MINRTQGEAEQFFKELWQDNKYTEPDKTVIKETSTGWRVELERMYGYATLSFARLSKISEFFGTKNINEDRRSQDGCETCDYGSSYTINLTIEEDK